jgi:hypothetical protein
MPSAAPACLSMDIGMLILRVCDSASDANAGAEAATVKIGAVTDQAYRTRHRACGLGVLFQALIAKGVAVRQVPSV